MSKKTIKEKMIIEIKHKRYDIETTLFLYFIFSYAALVSYMFYKVIVGPEPSSKVILLFALGPVLLLILSSYLSEFKFKISK